MSVEVEVGLHYSSDVHETFEPRLRQNVSTPRDRLETEATFLHYSVYYDKTQDVMWLTRNLS